MPAKTIIHGEPLPAGGAPDASGRVIDGYRLVRRIGEGGMGEVWLAAQEAPVRREVALKLVRTGMDSQRIAARFEAERQALALMSHPAIATVLDGGSTSAGQPYFVMEYVDGRPVTEYADAVCAPLRARIALFLEICHGVHHAHQKAVIHRDLKPSNILVSVASGRPQPKIIDFGIAKALAHRLAPHGQTTEQGLLLGTPEYMSPEQADLTSGDIDTRSDVYSLGALLYELLAGALPFDSERLRARGLDELRRTIREIDPPPPSVRLAALATADTVAAARASDPASLTRALRGDLDAIVMKALEKERGQRYGSAAELADDLQRYLADAPIRARPAHLGYRMRKYARRHRAGVAVAGAAAALLLGFTITLAVEVRQASRERDRANREAEVARRTLDFVVDMFKVSDPDRSRGKRITAREILDQSSAQIGRELVQEPEVQARLMSSIARVYDQLGLDDSALPLAERAVLTQLLVLGPEDRETLRSQTDLATIERELGAFASAEQQLRAVIAIQRRVLGADHPDTLTADYQLAAVLAQRGHPAEADRVLREVIAGRARLLGPSDRATLVAINALALTLSARGRHDEAEGLLREVYALQRVQVGADHPTAIAALHNLGSCLVRSRHFAEARIVNTEVVATSRRILGREHPETLGAMDNLAFALSGLHERAAAEQLMREVLAVKRRVLPVGHPQTALTLYNLACLLALQGQTAEALAYLRDSLDHGMPGRIAKGIADDPDLASLRGDVTFEALAARGRSR